jgi:hypothetical protein
MLQLRNGKPDGLTIVVACQIAPIKWYHWVPTLGGRSVRPIMDRVSVALAHATKRKDLPLTPDYTVQLQDYDIKVRS